MILQIIKSTLQERGSASLQELASISKYNQTVVTRALEKWIDKGMIEKIELSACSGCSSCCSDRKEQQVYYKWIKKHKNS